MKIHNAVIFLRKRSFSNIVHSIGIPIIGNGQLDKPKGRGWDDLFLNSPRIIDDFLPEREQMTLEKRCFGA